MRTVLSLLIVAALAIPLAKAQTTTGPAPTAPGLQSATLPPLLDREVFFGNPEISNSQVSPDGRFIAFQKPNGGVMNVWVAAIGEPLSAARPLTADARPVPGYFWSRDGRRVLYVQDRGGDENYHVYAIDPAAAADASGVPPARDLTPFEGIQVAFYDVPRDAPGQILVGMNDRDPAWHDAYRVDLATGERTLLFENTRQLTGLVADDAGTPHFVTRVTEDGSTEILTVDGGQIGDVVYSCSVLETCEPVRLHPDGHRLYLQTNHGPRDLVELVLLDPATRTETLVERDPEGEADFGNALFSDATGDLLLTSYTGARERLYPHTDQMRDAIATLRRTLPDGDLDFTSTTADERVWTVAVSRDVDPGAVYVFDRDAGTAELLYRGRPNVPVESMAEMRPVSYTARDGMEIHAYLTAPRGAEARSLPTLLLPHGGPWARDEWGYSGLVQFLANRGYAVLQPNFRGSTGYGKRHLDAGNGEWGTGAMQHDLSDAVAYLVSEGIADPERVGIIGGSYGGYATLAGLAFTPELYAAGVDIVGPSNLITLLETIPPYWASIRTLFSVRMGDPATPEGRARLEAQSPLHSAEHIAAPLLVVQGANDPRVNMAEADQIVVALRDRGFPVRYLVAADEGHGFRDEINNLAMFAAIEAFLAEHLGGRYQPAMRPEIEQRLRALTVDPATVTLAATPADPADGR